MFTTTQTWNLDQASGGGEGRQRQAWDKAGRVHNPLGGEEREGAPPSNPISSEGIGAPTLSSHKRSAAGGERERPAGKCPPRGAANSPHRARGKTKFRLV